MKQLPNFLDYEPDDLDVRITDLIVATSDGNDPLTHPKVAEALAILRHRLDMDVVFVSQISQNRRTFKVVERSDSFLRIEAGQSDPIEETWCQHVVEGRMPGYVRDATPLVRGGALPEPGFPIGTHMSTPIRMPNGDVYGTLCCFSGGVVEKSSELDLRRLQIAASVLADELHKVGVGLELKLQPLDGGAAA